MLGALPAAILTARAPSPRGAAMPGTGNGGEIDTRGVGWSGGRAPVTECNDLAVVCHEQARVCPSGGAR